MIIEIATKNVDGLAYLNNFFNECILATSASVFTKDVRWNEYPNPIHVI
ncbi:MAG: hypothetical protein LBV57_06090 [Candidatus Symbiothrix sp.]|nr:hypothetical protein [Candidatus Symbiothrix sp.]